MKTVLYISYDGMTDPLGQSQVLPYLCGLSAEGYKIHLISAEKSDKYKELKGIIQEICNVNNIHWHPITYHNRPLIFGTLFDLYRIRKLASALHRKESFSLVHCRSYMPSFTGVWLKTKYNIPYLFDMRGFWVNEKEDGNVWDLRNPVMKRVFDFMKRKESTFFKTADAVISLTHKAIPEIRKITGTSNDHQPIEVIPCCVDTNHFNYNTVSTDIANEWKKKLKLPEDSFILCYLGSISTWYLPDEMLLFFKQFLNVQPNAIFLIITLENTDTFVSKAIETGIDRSRIIVTSSRRKELPALLSLCHASLFFIKPAYSKIASSPTKLGELMSMGLPVICNAGVGDTEELVIESGSGVVCRNFNEKEYDLIAREFSQLYTGFRKEKLREEAIRLFSIEKGIARYKKTYRYLMRQE